MKNLGATTIERLVKKWVPLLGLTHWRIDVKFDERQVAASCAAMPTYENGTVSFNLPYIRKHYHVLEEVEDLVVHELVHCMIWQSSERAVTQVARSLMRVQDAERRRRRK